MGCTIYELATGHILFPGKTNNHMLLLMQQLRGKPSTKQLRKCTLASRHFEDNHTFLSIQVDQVTGEVRQHTHPDACKTCEYDTSYQGPTSYPASQGLRKAHAPR